jgi:DNA-binding CsgD family transcriptional regulator
MQQFNSANKAEYIQQIIVPQYQHLMASDLLFHIKDAEFKRIISAHHLAQEIEGMQDGFSGQGLKDSEISTYDEEALELINAADCAVKQFLKPIEVIYIVNNQTIKAVKTPLFYPNGDFFGIRTMVSKLEVIYPFQFIKAMNCHKADQAIVLENTMRELNDDEKSVLYLLLNGHSRNRIADLLLCNISKVSRIINNLCNRFGILANHQERLLTYAIKHGLFRFIPEQVIAKVTQANSRQLTCAA